MCFQENRNLDIKSEFLCLITCLYVYLKYAQRDERLSHICITKEN